MTQHDFRTRGGFTLVELMVVIVLMSILAGMLTYAISSARQDSRISRTQAEVRMISQMLQQTMNEISLGSVSLSYSDPANPTVIGTDPPNSAQEKSRLVMMARRDLLRMHLPACRADLIYPPTNLQFRTPSNLDGDPDNTWYANCAKVAVPSQWNRMRSLIGLRSAGQADNAYQDAANVSYSPSVEPGYDAAQLYANNSDYKAALDTRLSGDALTWTRQYESAECLYLILATTELFGETAIDKIHDRSIADLDGDGMKEIIDPWGRPYEFIRNPVGLQTPALKNYDPSDDTYPVDPDPLDFLLTDWRYDMASDQSFYPIYLPPTVISAGPDGEFDLRRTYYDQENEFSLNQAYDPSQGSPAGVNNNYSTGVIAWDNSSGFLSPLYPNLIGSGALPYRFPDPFYNVSAIPYSAGSTPPYPITNGDLGQVNFAKWDPDLGAGGGLGGTVIGNDDYDASADNISSLDGGF